MDNEKLLNNHVYMVSSFINFHETSFYEKEKLITLMQDMIKLTDTIGVGLKESGLDLQKLRNIRSELVIIYKKVLE